MINQLIKQKLELYFNKAQNYLNPYMIKQKNYAN